MRNIEAELMPVGTVQQADAQLFIDWMFAQRESNQFDSTTLASPRACVLKASRNDQTLAMLPLQPVLMLESLVRDPDLAKSAVTLSLYRMHQVVLKAMQDGGYTEAFFMTTNQQFADFCVSTNEGWQIAMFDPEKKVWLLKLQRPWQQPTQETTDAK